jgi:hypothetical protein
MSQTKKIVSAAARNPTAAKRLEALNSIESQRSQNACAQKTLHPKHLRVGTILA